jgi:GT2 family glycosyltransferase
VNEVSAAPVTFCVVNYNGAGFIADALAAIGSEKRAADELIVVDSASSDDSTSFIRSLDYPLRLIELDTNLGPGVARNTGFRAAAHDLILFLDNDVVLNRGCTRLLAQALQEHGTALTAAPRVLYAADRSVVQYEGADCHFLGLMVPRCANRAAATCTDRSVATNNSLVTACFMIDRTLWDDDDLFDDSFFFSYEDHDFGVRSRVLGHQLLSVPPATVLHGKGTEGLSYRPGVEISRTRAYCLIRNRWQVLSKNYSLRTLLILAPALIIYEIVQFGGAIRLGWLGLWCRAAWWNITHRRRLIERRRTIQAKRRTPDREIFEGGALPFTAGLARGRMDRAAVTCLNAVMSVYWRAARRFI